MNPFKKTYTPIEQRYFKFLSRNKLFLKLSKKELLLFIPFLHLRTYRENEVVFFRNDPSQAIYLIKSGEVTLQLDIDDRFETISHVREHASVGNNALLKNTKRIYNAIVTSPVCEMYVIPQVNILDIFENRPLIKAKMLESLSDIFNADFKNLFHSYRSTHGFFDLNDIFGDLGYGC